MSTNSSEQLSTYHALKGGDDMKARNEYCACQIVRENHYVGADGQLACPGLKASYFSGTGAFYPNSPAVRGRTEEAKGQP